METTTVRLESGTKDEIKAQLEYEDSMGEWIRDAINQKLEQTEAEA